MNLIGFLFIFTGFKEHFGIIIQNTKITATPDIVT